MRWFRYFLYFTFFSIAVIWYEYLIVQIKIDDCMDQGLMFSYEVELCKTGEGYQRPLVGLFKWIFLLLSFVGFELMRAVVKKYVIFKKE